MYIGLNDLRWCIWADNPSSACNWCCWCADADDALMLMMRCCCGCTDAADALMLLMHLCCWCTVADDGLLLLIHCCCWCAVAADAANALMLLMRWCCWCTEMLLNKDQDQLADLSILAFCSGFIYANMYIVFSIYANICTKIFSLIDNDWRPLDVYLWLWWKKLFTVLCPTVSLR